MLFASAVVIGAGLSSPLHAQLGLRLAPVQAVTDGVLGGVRPTPTIQGAANTAVRAAKATAPSTVAQVVTPVVKSASASATQIAAPVIAAVTPVAEAATSSLRVDTTPLANAVAPLASVTRAAASDLLRPLSGATPLHTVAVPTPMRTSERPATLIASGSSALLLGPKGAAQFAEQRSSALPPAPLVPAAPVDGAGAPSPPNHRIRLAERAQQNPAVLETSAAGDVLVRGVVLALHPSRAVLQRARDLGFTVAGEHGGVAALEVVALSTPAGVSSEAGLAQLLALDPQGIFDLDPLYAEAGEVAVGSPAAPRPISGSHAGMTVGLVDHGVDARHASLKGVRIDQKAFANVVAPGAHGLATASLLIGSDGSFRGGKPGGKLFVADIFGSAATGGSALELIQALAWMAKENVPVINISLVGPRNRAVEAAVGALVSRGFIIVAAAGNDGPTSPPLYPAAYPGVIAVTAVDGRDRVLPEANRGDYLMFAAPGADMAAAGSGGYVSVRGTSFAAPMVASLLAADLSKPDPAKAIAAIATLMRQAKDLGAPGRDPVYGNGLVASDGRTAPLLVAARGALTD